MNTIILQVFPFPFGVITCIVFLSVMFCLYHSLFFVCISEATEEVSLDSPEREPILSDGPSPAITPVTPTAMLTPRMGLGTAEMFERSLDEVRSWVKLALDADLGPVWDFPK